MNKNEMSQVHSVTKFHFGVKNVYSLASSPSPIPMYPKFYMFHVLWINQMYKFFLKSPTNALGYMNVILLRSNHHVAATHAYTQRGGNRNSNTVISLQSCMLVLASLRMATLVAETCWRLLFYNKITFIYPSAFVGLFIQFYTLR
jgi:hypothetical protein